MRASQLWLKDQTCKNFVSSPAMQRLQKLKQFLVGTLCHVKYVVERLNQEMNICGEIVVTNWQASQSQGMYNIKV